MLLKYFFCFGFVTLGFYFTYAILNVKKKTGYPTLNYPFSYPTCVLRRYIMFFFVTIKNNNIKCKDLNWTR